MRYPNGIRVTHPFNLFVMEKEFLLQTNPAFLLIPLEEDKYVFYNSIGHIGACLSRVEVMVLDLLYKYQSEDYIISLFPSHQADVLRSAFVKIKQKQLLSEAAPASSNDIEGETFPNTYYLHLTYRCNLSCSYCYNRKIRSRHSKTLSIEQWKSIVDEIAPFARTIILTGGECFLYEGIVDVVKYIRERIPSVRIQCISNGIHDYKAENTSEVFDYLDGVTFSCDSIESAGLRKGFKPDVFRNNVSWLRRIYPQKQIVIASTETCSNAQDMEKTEHFCKENSCDFDKTILIPEGCEDIKMMPSFTMQKKMCQHIPSSYAMKRLNPPRIRCSAAKEVCSIDPSGNVYPCQSLHYQEFLLGNILKDGIKGLRSIGKKGLCLPTVNDLPVCSKCKVKYICGGGCLATSFSLPAHRATNNHLTCYMNYQNSIIQLKCLQNHL